MVIFPNFFYSEKIGSIFQNTRKFGNFRIFLGKKGMLQALANDLKGCKKRLKTNSYCFCLNLKRGCVSPRQCRIICVYKFRTLNQFKNFIHWAASGGLQRMLFVILSKHDKAWKVSGSITLHDYSTEHSNLWKEQAHRVHNLRGALTRSRCEVVLQHKFWLALSVGKQYFFI